MELGGHGSRSAALWTRQRGALGFIGPARGRCEARSKACCVATVCVAWLLLGVVGLEGETVAMSYVRLKPWLDRWSGNESPVRGEMHGARQLSREPRFLSLRERWLPPMGSGHRSWFGCDRPSTPMLVLHTTLRGTGGKERDGNLATASCDGL